MRKVTALILIAAALGLGGCAVGDWLSGDRVAAERKALTDRIAVLDGKIAAAESAAAAYQAKARENGDQEAVKAAHQLLTAVSAMRAEREDTQKRKDELPKPDHGGWWILGEAVLALVLGERGVRFAKVFRERGKDLEEAEAQVKALVAGIEKAMREAKDKDGHTSKEALYQALGDMAEEHTADAMGLAKKVAAIKAELRGSV